MRARSYCLGARRAPVEGTSGVKHKDCVSGLLVAAAAADPKG